MHENDYVYVEVRWNSKGGRVPPLIRWHLVNFVNERRHVSLCHPPRTASKASGLLPRSMLCCYQVKWTDLRILDLSLNTKDRESKRAEDDAEDYTICSPSGSLSDCLIKCIFEDFSYRINDTVNIYR